MNSGAKESQYITYTHWKRGISSATFWAPWTGDFEKQCLQTILHSELLKELLKKYDE